MRWVEVVGMLVAGLVVGLGACATQVGGADPAGEPTRDPSGDGDGDADDDPPARPDPGDPGPVDPAEPDTCSAIEVSADPVTLPADIVWVIDNSGSMDVEEARVQDNLNAFAQDIADSGIDYRVVMITNRDHVSVPPPLGGSDRLLEIDQDVDSNNALELVLETYPRWRDFLRPEAIKHFVAVTDDESDMSEAEFEQELAALGTPGFVFHAVVAESPPWDWNSSCFLLAAAIGATYIDLQEDHGGVFYSLCESDWTPLFDALSGSVASLSALPCAFDIPAPEDGDAIDYDAVNFVYTPEGDDSTTIPFVGAEGACDADGGWYYDDADAPRQILACPATCDRLVDGAGEVEVAFGCATLLE